MTHQPRPMAWGWSLDILRLDFVVHFVAHFVESELGG